MQWLFISVSAGLIGCLFMHYFIWTVQWIIQLIQGSSIPLYLWPLVGALIVSGIITIEMFGLYYSLSAGLASVIGFQINRHNTLYDSVLNDKIEANQSEKTTAPPLKKIEIPQVEENPPGNF
ncbi:MAG: hypothetical protein PF447_00875 [Spirochaetaceae bacterium]|jgi:hypothetical protein|nr:hypothetical protein [Spirochaetaceae bacterium]